MTVDESTVHEMIAVWDCTTTRCYLRCASAAAKPSNKVCKTGEGYGFSSPSGIVEPILTPRRPEPPTPKVAHGKQGLVDDHTASGERDASENGRQTDERDENRTYPRQLHILAVGRWHDFYANGDDHCCDGCHQQQEANGELWFCHFQKGSELVNEPISQSPEARRRSPVACARNATAN